MKQETLSPKAEGLFLKLGTEYDADIVVDLSLDLYTGSVYNGTSAFDPAVVRDNYLNSLKLGNSVFCAILLIRGSRCIGFLVCSKQTPVFTKDVYATEQGFWIYPQYKTIAGMKKLLEAYYYWAKAVGCKGAFIGKLNKDKVEQYRLKTWL